MWSKVLSSVDAIMKTSKKKVAEVEQHVEETSEVVEVMVVCDEDVETLLFLKGSKGMCMYAQFKLFPIIKR